jgi:hypothetical protein
LPGGSCLSNVHMPVIPLSLPAVLYLFTPIRLE